MSTNASQHPPDSLVGTILDDRFQILSVIGEGNTSRVYKAHHLVQDIDVALKVLNAEQASSKSSLRRFAHEARVLGYMTHPGIINIGEMGTTPDGKPYFSIDLVEGRSLAEVLNDIGPLVSHTAVNVFQQACNALQSCHQLGVVHRGLSPGDIMLMPSEEEDAFVVRIVDFGQSRSRPSGPEDKLIEELDAPGEIVGSPYYMSPEQRRATPADPRSDVYALGCVLYEALTGKVPFAGNDLEEISSKHLNDEPPSLADAWSVPGSLATIVMKALEKDPLKRYQSMQEMSVALGGKNTQQIKMLNKMGKHIQDH